MPKLSSVTEIYSTTRILSAAELIAFAGGAIEVVSPPGDGKIIWPLSFMLIYNFGTFDFSVSAALDLQSHGSGLPVISAGLVAMFGSGASTVEQAIGQLDAGFADFVPSYIDLGIDLVLTGGSFAAGGISAATIGAAGTGYALHDTGVVTTGNADATYEITGVGALGIVTSFIITFPGTGYATGAGQATATGGGQPGIGTNFTVDVTAINDGDGSLKVTTLYQVIDVP